MSGKTIEKPDTSKWWACACVKRDRKGKMSHIKLHPPTTRKCKTCGAKSLRFGGASNG